MNENKQKYKGTEQNSCEWTMYIYIYIYIYRLTSKQSKTNKTQCGKIEILTTKPIMID